MYAAWKIAFSLKAFPINWNPIGIPLLSSAHGIFIAGEPIIFTETVHISARYISNGLSIFSPILKAADGTVGIKTKSYLSNNSLNLAFRYALTF